MSPSCNVWNYTYSTLLASSLIGNSPLVNRGAWLQWKKRYQICSVFCVPIFFFTRESCLQHLKWLSMLVVRTRGQTQTQWPWWKVLNDLAISMLLVTGIGGEKHPLIIATQSFLSLLLHIGIWKLRPGISSQMDHLFKPGKIGGKTSPL